MSYKDRTYVIFDGDNDMWAYAYMKGWKNNDRIVFDFKDSHDLKPLTSNAENEQYIKQRLRERLKASDQFIVLVGERTKHLYKFVRWEIDTALALDLPPIIVHLNNKRKIDNDLCPPILKGENGVHVSFKMKIIKYAIDNWPSYYHNKVDKDKEDNWHYKDDVYKKLEL